MSELNKIKEELKKEETICFCITEHSCIIKNGFKPFVKYIIRPCVKYIFKPIGKGIKKITHPFMLCVKDSSCFIVCGRTNVN